MPEVSRVELGQLKTEGSVLGIGRVFGDFSSLSPGTGLKHVQGEGS